MGEIPEDIKLAAHAAAEQMLGNHWRGRDVEIIAETILADREKGDKREFQAFVAGAEAAVRFTVEHNEGYTSRPGAEETRFGELFLQMEKIEPQTKESAELLERRIRAIMYIFGIRSLDHE